jgi:short-subunit dehydrogenase
MEELQRVKNKCAHPENVHIVLLDQAKENSVREAAKEVFETHKQVDYLFNNGGISQRAAALDTPIDIDRQLFEINFFSNILLSKLVAAEMVKHKSGHIIVTSSLLGKWGFFLRSGYAATKHALHGFYDSMRMELEGQGIKISLVLPGFIATEISVHAVDKNGKSTGEMDPNQANGISADACAEQIMHNLAKGRNEFGVGGQELLGLKVKRFFPKMFENILRKRSAK